MLALTHRVGVGVSVMVIPLRQPLVLARQLATLDSLSGGRLSFGVGMGGVLEEYDCAGVDRADRGARLDEYVEVLELLWSEETPSFSGRFVSFPELYCSPKPTRRGIPVWFGGHTSATLDRAASHGAGLAAGSVTPDRAAELVAELRRRAEDAGRDPSDVGMLVMANDRQQDRLLRLLDAHREAGVTEAVIGARGRTPDEIAESVATIAALASQMG
jgi:probable F420-dependent oxidoreductase